MSINVKALIACLLLAIGAVGGFLNAQDYYQPRLDSANRELDSATAARDNLEALATEQGQKLGELVRLGQEREALASKAQAEAHTVAQTSYEQANRLMADRIGGDQCKAATAVIDQELFGL